MRQVTSPATEVEGALAELAAGSTDDQNIESLGVDVGTNILTVGIEDGTSQTVIFLTWTIGTDDQNIEGLALSGAKRLTVGIEDGTSHGWIYPVWWALTTRI